MIYEIAGLRIKIENSFEFTDKFCKAYPCGIALYGDGKYHDGMCKGGR